MDKRGIDGKRTESDGGDFKDEDAAERCRGLCAEGLAEIPDRPRRSHSDSGGRVDLACRYEEERERVVAKLLRGFNEENDRIKKLRATLNMIKGTAGKSMADLRGWEVDETDEESSGSGKWKVKRA